MYSPGSLQYSNRAVRVRGKCIINNQGLQSSEAPQAAIPPALVTTCFRPDIVVYNTITQLHAP